MIAQSLARRARGLKRRRTMMQQPRGQRFDLGVRPAEDAVMTVRDLVAGYGAADKAQVQAMVCRLLGLVQVPARDAADALAIAICHGAQCRTAARQATALRGARA